MFGRNNANVVKPNASRGFVIFLAVWHNKKPYKLVTQATEWYLFLCCDRRLKRVVKKHMANNRDAS